MYFLIACIFIFFTWDFFEDFKAGIQKNQTAVEEAKDRFGVKYPAHHLLEMFIGSGYIDWMSVKNPKKTHNYLERTYTLDDMVDNKDEFEVYHLSGSDLYNRYYVHN